MSSYLGIQPTERLDYYFVSYNNDDAERLTHLMQELLHFNIPLWYDYGLEYGEHWQQVIAERIRDCQGVLLFVTKSLIKKTLSYVRTEYEMAARYYDKPIYTILVDEVDKEEIPPAQLAWWIEINQKQTLHLKDFPSIESRMPQFVRMLKIEKNEDRTAALMKDYSRCIEEKNFKRAQGLLAEVLHGKELEAKAQIMLKLCNRELSSACIDPHVLSETIAIRDLSFRAKGRSVWNAINSGDPCILEIYRDKDIIFTVGGLMEAWGGDFLYDEKEDLLYVIYSSSPTVRNDHPMSMKGFESVIIIEHPTKEAICHNYLHPTLLEYRK